MMMDKSWAPGFRGLVFKKIDERRYTELYSDLDTLAERTIYYNRKRLLEYEAQTGRNLLEEEFQAMADDALEELGLLDGNQSGNHPVQSPNIVAQYQSDSIKNPSGAFCGDANTSFKFPL